MKAFFTSNSMKARFRLVVQRLKRSSIFFLLVSLFVLVVCWERIVITIPAGYGGVQWYLLFGGTRKAENSLGEGVHVIFPWNRIYMYNLRLQNYDTSYNVVTKNGLEIKVSVSIRWRANSAQVGELHQKYGREYRDTLLVPAIGSISREVISRYTVNDLVADKRAKIQAEIFRTVVSDSVPNGIGTLNGANRSNVVILEDVLITEVSLPPKVRAAIEAKLQQAQIVEEYGYRVQRESLESQRKAVEAEGIRKFQEIVASNMTNNYLRWRGIEATLELARSPNSKVVVIGNDKSGGMPLILDGADRPTGTLPAQGRVSSPKPSVAKSAPTPTTTATSTK
jgi:regulator of protease activity HflC (stomatin/prohibitin superfamily)